METISLGLNSMVTNTTHSILIEPKRIKWKTEFQIFFLEFKIRVATPANFFARSSFFDKKYCHFTHVSSKWSWGRENWCGNVSFPPSFLNLHSVRKRDNKCRPDIELTVKKKMKTTYPWFGTYTDNESPLPVNCNQ